MDKEFRMPPRDPDIAKNDAHWQHRAPLFVAIKFSLKSVEQHKK
jgi:hypothetical protein